MNITPISNVNFGRVIAVAGTKKQVENLKESLSQSGCQETKDYLFDNATSLYVDRPAKGPLSKAANEGKEIVLITTGEDVSKVMFMDRGWTSVNGISQHISDFFDVSSQYSQRAEEIKNIIEDDKVSKQ